MQNKKPDNIVPENKEGSSTDTSFSKQCPSIEEAIAAFEDTRSRLLNISEWHSYAGTGTADFQLTDNEGNRVNRLAQEGDHFQINIPGPGSKTGEGFDWVQIMQIEEQRDRNSIEYTAITVRPATNPNNKEPDTAHFFQEQATSTFMVVRNGLEITVEIHGRNETPNLNSKHFIDKLRNVAIAAGAMLGFSNIQWNSLAKGILKLKTDE